MTKRKKPETPGGCVCLSLRKAARMMAQLYDRHLQPVDLRNTQFSLLAAISILAPVSVSALAGEMAMDRTTLTRNLRVLQRRNLVDVGPGPDGRTRAIGLTPAGNALLERAMPLWRQAQASMLDGFGTRRWGNFSRELGEIEQLAHSLD